MRILAVDDEPDVLLLVKASLRTTGHEVLTAATADEARTLCEEQRPDLLLLDISMPGLSGPDLLRQLRAAALAPDDVLLLSAMRPEHVEEVARELGVGYVLKPFTPAALREALQPTLR